MHVGFTGTQIGMTPDQKRVFTHFMKTCEGLIFHHGDCIGADYDAHIIARKHNLKIVLHPPNYGGKRAFCEADESREEKPYIERNHDIVDESDAVFATPKGPEVMRSGTWATVRYARKTGTPLFIIYPDGHLEN